MKVGELIEELKKHPLEATVRIPESSATYGEVDRVALETTRDGVAVVTIETARG